MTSTAIVPDPSPGDSVFSLVDIPVGYEENFAVQREIRERVKAAFDVAGIRAPQVMRPYGGEPGGTPPQT